MSYICDFKTLPTANMVSGVENDHLYTKSTVLKVK